MRVRKANIKLHLILLLGIISFTMSCCKKEPSTPIYTPVTQSGAKTFAYKIDGKAYITDHYEFEGRCSPVVTHYSRYVGQETTCHHFKDSSYKRFEASTDMDHFLFSFIPDFGNIEFNFLIDADKSHTNELLDIDLSMIKSFILSEFDSRIYAGETDFFHFNILDRKDKHYVMGGRLDIRTPKYLLIKKIS